MIKYVSALLIAAAILFVSAYAHDVIIEDGHAMFPVRPLFEGLGFDVVWDDNQRTATLTRDGDRIILLIDGDYFTINGEPIQIEASARIVNDRMFAPVDRLLLAIDTLRQEIATIAEITTVTEWNDPLLSIIAVDILRLVGNTSENAAHLCHDEITDAIKGIVAANDKLPEYPITFDDLFVLIWDDLPPFVYSTVPQYLIETLMPLLAVSEFLPGKVVVYFYGERRVAVGLRSILDEIRGFLADGGLTDNDRDVLFLEIMARETIVRLFNHDTGTIDPNSDEIAEILEIVLARLDSIFQRAGHHTIDNLYVVIWDRQSPFVYTAAPQALRERALLAISTGHFSRHEAGLYRYNNWVIAVGFNHIMAS